VQTTAATWYEPFSYIISYMDIYQKVKKLRLPAGKYIVHAGSALEGYGIRKSHDVDIAVTEDVYRMLKKKGRKEKEISGGRKRLVKGIYEVGSNFGYGNYQVTVDDLLETSVNIKGVPFAHIKEVVKLKKASTRDKDKKDLELINKYLSK
jgi:hypothetical protein